MVVGCVHATFRRVERAADWLTGRAGPYFVALGFSLLTTAGASFFLTMLPLRAPAPAPLASLFDTHSPLHILLGIVPTFAASFSRTYAADTLRWLAAYAACAYILYMIGWAYLMACLEPAGNPVLGLGDGLQERRVGPGSGMWWARYRERAALASGPPLRRQQQQQQQPASGAGSATAASTSASSPLLDGSGAGGAGLDYEPASPIRLDPAAAGSGSGSGSSSRRGSSSATPNGQHHHHHQQQPQRKTSFSLALSTLLRPITGSSLAEYSDPKRKMSGSTASGTPILTTGTGTGFLPRAPTPGTSISGRRSAQGQKTRGGSSSTNGNGSASGSGSGSGGAPGLQIPLGPLPSKPGRTPDLEASLMPEPFAPLRPTALKPGSGSSSSSSSSAAAAAFTPLFAADDLPSAPIATPTDATPLVRPTPIYPDTSGDAFDLELDSEDLFPLPAKMCTKCKPVPLYVAIASLPPEMRKVEKMLRVGARERELERLRRGGGIDRGSSTAGTPDGRAAGGRKGGKGKKNSKRNRGRGGGGGMHSLDASESDVPASPLAHDSDSFFPANAHAHTRLHAPPTSIAIPLPLVSSPENEYLPHYVLQETDEDEDEGEADIRAWLGEEEAMRLVPPPKPERSHHCSVCKTCVTKFDHHCPWINACVGLGNERYFVLFLFWLSVGCATVVGVGYPLLPHVVRGWSAAMVGLTGTSSKARGLGSGGAKYRPFSAENDSPALRGYTGLDYIPPVDDPLSSHLLASAGTQPLQSRSPFDVDVNVDMDLSVLTRVFVLLSLLVCALMGFAVFIMFVWQLIMVGRGETTVESHDNGYYRKLAKRRGQRFINVYDVGFFRNLALFFSLGPGSPHSFITVFLPLRIPPYSDGWHWAKRRGLGGRHAGIVPVEELTDDEGEAEGEGGSGGAQNGHQHHPQQHQQLQHRHQHQHQHQHQHHQPGPASPVMAVLDESILTADLDRY
ncbi:hypothetical protein OC835_007581 [Tilletia horrida]|nr:hypothetical protein OC835_007581 [Tilletia horrida]